jgi:nitrite reductase/ring-hydroxylating ferredoxin subunit
MFKQVFDLVSGLCLDDATVSLRVFPVTVRDGVVHVLSPVAAGSGLSGSG